jgi:putative PIN family toxin of toxin-antitoxin system
MSSKHIAGNMRLVLDTSVLVAAIRSPSGASAEILRRVLRAELTMLASVPLYAEYEAVATRSDHLARAAATVKEVENLLDALATRLEPVEIRFLWRPQLKDADDEMVLETAVNGRAEAIVTFNRRDFEPAANRFGIAVLAPSEVLQRL